MSVSIEVREAGKPAAPSFGRRCRLVYLIVAIMTIMSVGSVAMLLVGVLTLFQARRFYREVMARWLGRAILRVAGVKMIVHQDGPLPQTQTVYISNHTSSLDVFILIALGLPNARFFLSGFLRKHPPIAIVGYMTGIFWTVVQSMPERRTKIFQRAERVLRRTGESVYLSPEGERVTTGEIGHFNKGAFHLATSLGAPLLPFYIAIPREVDPGMGLNVQPGVVHVYFKPAIPTSDWKIEDLDRNRQQVRAYFIELHEELKPR